MFPFIISFALSLATYVINFGLESPRHPCEDQEKSRLTGVIALAGIFSFDETAQNTSSQLQFNYSISSHLFASGENKGVTCKLL